MSGRILEGGGLLGGYSFDETKAEPDTHLAFKIADDVVDAAVRLQSKSEEYSRMRRGDDAGRHCAIEALRAVSILLRPNTPTEWAEDLAYHLAQLDDGIISPMVARPPRERRGAPPRNIQRAVLRIFGSAYLSMLVKAGMRLAEADAKVKRRMKARFTRIGVRLGSSTLKNWRWQLSPNEGRGTPDAEIYRELLQWADLQNLRTVKDADDWGDTWITAPF
jgi:hypothetical protein